MQSKSSDNRHGAENRGSVVAAGGGTVKEVVPPTGRIITPNLRIFTYAELIKSASPDTVLGGFARVVTGWVDGETLASSKPGVGMPVSITERFPRSGQGLREWQAEVEFLGKLSHPNLVKLLGYCMEDEQYLLVYEYMEKGSLETHLFREGGDPIPWDTRLNIATGAARGLTFLHTMENQVIDNHYNASNILLDGDFNAKLLHFRLAKLGPADSGTTHFFNVFGFGVMLYELLSGQQICNTTGASGVQNFIDWGKSVRSKERKLEKIMDPRLENQYPPKAAFEAAELVLKCTESDSDSKNRPPMEEVLVTLEHINSIKMNPKAGKTKGKMNPKESKASEKYHARGPPPPKTWKFASV